MKTLKKWLVGLDLSDHDDAIIRFTKQLSDILRPEHIEFVHVSHQLPDAVHVHLPASLQYPTYDHLFDKLNKEVYKYYSSQDPVSCEVMDGPVQFDLWHETWVKEIDLFIAGGKPRHQGRGIFPKRFVRKSFCSVLFVPQEVPKQLDKILVPTDFSDRSGEALALALHMAAASGDNIDVVLHHLYKMPHAYYYQGFPKEEVLEAVKNEAQEECNSFLQQFNPDQSPLEITIKKLLTSFVAESVHQEAIQEEAGLILMAAGGKSRWSNIFLGSETEQMVQIEKEIPLLILKDRRNYVKLWELVNPNR